MKKKIKNTEKKFKNKYCILNTLKINKKYLYLIIVMNNVKNNIYIIYSNFYEYQKLMSQSVRFYFTQKSIAIKLIFLLKQKNY